MVKIIILLLAFGLSTLTTLLLNFDVPWKIAVSIIGFGLTFIVVFAILFFAFVGIFALCVKKDEKPAKYSSVYRKIYNLYQPFMLSLFGIKLTVNGLNKVPNDSNFILLQNHISNVDPIITDYVFRKYPLIFVAKESLFKIPFFGKIVRHIGYVKMTRKNGMDDAGEIIRGLRWLRAQEISLCVYPEGTRNKTYPEPQLLDFKEGSLAIAKKADKPIVVSVIHGTDKINEKLLFKVHKIQIDIIAVINPNEYAEWSAEELSNKVHKLMLDGINKPSKKREKVRLY